MDKSVNREDKEAFAALDSTTGVMPDAKPMTGDEYLQSLDDGREVYIYGERVENVLTHPAFRNTARMTARLYDAMHDPAHKDKIMVPTDTGNGGEKKATPVSSRSVPGRPPPIRARTSAGTSSRPI